LLVGGKEVAMTVPGSLISKEELFTEKFFQAPGREN
jgi:hypothetical protein